MQIFYVFECPRENDAFREILSRDYPGYLREPERLTEILNCFRCQGTITAILEPDYVDKQYRDSYYTYFSQKYGDYSRNCLRLAFFEGTVRKKHFSFSEDSSQWRKMEGRFIGTVVLRPLRVGMIGQTFLNPAKLNLQGCYLQTCRFHINVCGRNLTIPAFPFSSQDDESMTCAETTLYNLLRYYGEKYPEYRALSPTEILRNIEASYYERVLPSVGVEKENISKVLSDAHLYPRLYIADKGYGSLERILHIYVESGIPFMLGLPGHVVNCIGHGPLERSFSDAEAARHVKPATTRKDGTEHTFYRLNTGALIKKYIIMDDNGSPYQVSSLYDITNKYYRDYKQDKGEMEIQDLPSEQIWRYDSLLVPLSRRIFIDAAKAWKIFDNLYLREDSFISAIREAYQDPEWGASPRHPLVWRIFLTTSNKYRDFKIRKVPETADYYMGNAFPRFIWALELGTLETFRRGLARAEVLLDATSSEHSENWGILSVGYQGHSVFVQSDRRKIEQAVDPAVPPRHRYLTAIHQVLYNKSSGAFGETFPTFGNLKSV